MRFYWSPKFTQALDVGGSPMFALDFDDDAGLGTFGDRLPVRLVLHSHGIKAGDNHVPHAIESISGGGQSVSVRDWTSRFGSLTVTLSGVDIAQLVARRIPRGLPCKLKMGFEGFSFDEFEQVGIYRFDSLTGSNNRWRMTLGDIGKVLQSATSRATTQATSVFSEFSTTTAVGFPYQPASDSTIVVTSGTGFVKDGEASTRGLVYCEATDGGYDPFYVKYSGVSGTVITVVNSDVMGTTRPLVTPPGGVDFNVTHVNYIHDDLPRLVQKFILDDADGAGTMPDLHNMGYFASGLINARDWDLWTTRWEGYTTFKAELFTPNIAQNPYRLIAGLMSELGAWLVMKEGRLSWRFAGDIGVTAAAKPYVIDYEITDQDIISADRYELFNSDTNEQVITVRFLDSTDSTTVNSNPATADRFDDKRANATAYDDDVDTTNRADAASNLEERLLKWYQSIPDALTLNLRGWSWLHMVPGDVVSVDSAYIPDLHAREPATLGRGRYASIVEPAVFMVTAVNPNWQDFSVTVELTRPRFLSAFSS